jgi:hypothetical protein
MKYSKVEGVIAWSGGTMALRKGVRFDEEHQLVAERPELFDDTDPGADHKAAPQVGHIERATAAPGEVRATPATGPAAGTARRTPRVSGQ